MILAFLSPATDSQSMPGGLVDGCGVRLAGAASYFPCTAWLWPEQAAEEAQPILQPPTQNLAEALIPPSQPGIPGSGEQQAIPCLSCNPKLASCHCISLGQGSPFLEQRDVLQSRKKVISKSHCAHADNEHNGLMGMQKDHYMHRSQRCKSGG